MTWEYVYILRLGERKVYHRGIEVRGRIVAHAPGSEGAGACVLGESSLTFRFGKGNRVDFDGYIDNSGAFVEFRFGRADKSDCDGKTVPSS